MLDIRTLFIIVAALSILVAVVVFVLYRYRFPIQGPSWWAAGSVSLAAGMSLTAARGVAPLFLSVVVANCFVLWYYVLVLNGMFLFLGRPSFLTSSRLVVAASATLAYGMFMHWFSAVDPNLTARIIATSLVSGSLTLTMGLALIKSERKVFGVLFSAGLMFAHSIADAVRIIAVSREHFASGFLHSGPVNAYYITFGILVMLGLAFGMVLMISEELNSRLQEQNSVLEENIRLRDEMEAITQHDLKSPIMPIVSLSELVLTTPGLPDCVALYVSEMRRAAQGALENINRSLDLYKLENGQYRLEPQAVDLKQVVFDLMQKFYPGASADSGRDTGNVRLCLNGKPCDSDEQCQCLGDGVLLRSMLSNLIKNAFEATHGDGRVEVDLDCSWEEVKLSVINDGEVPASLRDKFFEKFTTAGKRGGTGIGTYSSRLIAEAHGGNVRADFSIPGRTAVYVTLPVFYTSPGRDPQVLG